MNPTEHISMVIFFGFLLEKLTISLLHHSRLEILQSALSHLNARHTHLLELG